MDWGSAGAVLGIACIVVLAIVARRAVVDRDDARERLALSMGEQVRWKTAAATWRRLCLTISGLECCGAPADCELCRRVEKLEQQQCAPPA